MTTMERKLYCIKMNDDQGCLFPELDPFLTKQKNIDYMDLRDVVQTHTESFKRFNRDKYFIYKTGGTNPFMPDAGPNFPYIQNIITGRILKPTLMGGRDSYPTVSLVPDEHHEASPVKVKIHRAAGEAFLENDMPEKKLIVDHKNHNPHDYRLPNLMWVTPSQNSKKVKPRYTQQELTLEVIKINETK